MATRKVRYKKLNVKTLLPVVLFSEIDQNEYESLKNEQISTGVESAEENVSFVFSRRRPRRSCDHVSRLVTCTVLSRDHTTTPPL